jgi:tellurite resistance protein
MQFSEFFKKYQEVRNCILDENYLSSLLAIYPGILVAKADGVFGAEEKENLVSALKVASKEDPVVMCEMYSELCYLANADQSMQDAAMACIKEEIAGKDDLKQIILDIMQSTADADGSLSQEEQDKINEIKSTLSI